MANPILAGGSGNATGWSPTSSNTVETGSSPARSDHSPIRATSSCHHPHTPAFTPPSTSTNRPPHAGTGRNPASSSTSTSISNPPRRRIRPKIALDPNQPLTAQGKPRARVYVACNQCRTRKTRCDGAKPVCFHCHKRPPEDGSQCDYEPQPRRRGQDKAPGARGRKDAKRRRTSARSQDNSDSRAGSSASSGSSRSPSAERSAGSSQLRTPYDNFPGLASELSDSASEYDPFPADLSTILAPPAAEETHIQTRSEEAEPIPARPSLRFTRETWWDALLTFYASPDGTAPVDAMSFTAEQRSTTMRHIVSDLRALFQSSIYWVSFLHLPRFFDSVLSPTRRTAMQPSLLLSALAIGQLAQSSEAENGAPGRARAWRLLQMADSAIQASLASGWVDLGLIQATWLMAYFTMQYTHGGSDLGRSSLLLLDSLLRLFSLTTLDADVKRVSSAQQSHIHGAPSAAAASAIPGFPPYPAPPQTMFTEPPMGFYPLSQPDSVPVTTAPIVPPEPLIPDNITLGSSTALPSTRCQCAELTIGHHWPSVQGLAPSWAGTLMWPIGLSEGEFRKEECRRLVWASVMLTASVNSYTSVIEDIESMRLSIKDPRNFALMFPGESLALAGTPVQANNVWTLYLRSMLLLHSCVHTRGDPLLSEADRAEFAMKAWLEIDAIETALERHTCGLERGFGFQAREMLFSARMCVSHEFQRHIPQVTTQGSRLFYRDKAESWLRHRMEASERVWTNVTTERNCQSLDFRKPLLIYWFMSHIIKALVLWRADPTLVIALHASKIFARRAEYLMMFWPNAEQRREWQELRYRLVQACLKVGIEPPDASIPLPFPRRAAAPS